MEEDKENLSLSISNLTVKEIKRILKLVREMEEIDPQRTIFCQVFGFKGKTLEEARKILLEIFPKRNVAG